MASALKGIGNAKVFGNDPYFIEGEYKVQIQKVFLHNGMKGDNFIVRAKIVETSHPEKRPVGMVCAQVIKITGNASALGNIRGFMASCLDIDTTNDTAMEELNDTSCTELLDTGAFDGMVMNLQCNTKLTKVNKVEFTVHNWSVVKD